MSSSSSSSSDLPPKDAPTSIFATIPPFPPQNGDSPVKTSEFLSAASGIVTVLGKFGKVFAPVIHDMNGNIKKISLKFRENKEKYEFLEAMILQLKESNDLLAVDALQWLRRGLHFFGRFFTLLVEEYGLENKKNYERDIGLLVREAYNQTLEPYHGWLGSQLFHILIKFLPGKRNFFYPLAFDRYDHEQNVLSDLQIYVPNLEASVLRLKSFYREHNLETNYRV